MSEYNKLKNKGLGRGRPALKPEEREQRKEVNAKKQEARRRAHIVLQHRYPDEYGLIQYQRRVDGSRYV
jgi:hypothetical protein